MPRGQLCGMVDPICHRALREKGHRCCHCATIHPHSLLPVVHTWARRAAKTSNGAALLGAGGVLATHKDPTVSGAPWQRVGAPTELFSAERKRSATTQLPRGSTGGRKGGWGGSSPPELWRERFVEGCGGSFRVVTILERGWGR